MTVNKPAIVFLGTYPPRECGIATFTQDLLVFSQKLLGSRVTCKVAALNLSPLDTYKYPQEVEWELDQNNRREYTDFAKIVNNDTGISGVIIQHEYGIFGGDDGEYLVSFMKHCRKPMLVTLHTVLPEPHTNMKAVTERIISLATSIVVLTENSKKIIEAVYPESAGKVFVIPHGIHDSQFSYAKPYKERLELNNHIILSTFGLISRGKGIKYVIQALPAVIKKYPSVLYLILGETHPVIRRMEGEKYRIELAGLIKKLGLKKHVRFYDQYLSLSDLTEFLKATDIYIATSTNPNQAVSGTFSYALGTGRAVVSTEFAQAKEIITPEIGRLVPIKNPPAIQAALLELLQDTKQLKRMNRNAYAITRPMLWSNVAEKYVHLLARTVVSGINLKHLHTMTDDFGLFQFASYDIPNKESGYTLDDNARALILCSRLMKQNASRELENLLKLYLNFIQKCQLPDGSFINYLDRNRIPTKQNTEEDLEDAQSRSLWALSEVFSKTVLNSKLREQAKQMFVLNLLRKESPDHLRSLATRIKAYADASEYVPEYRIYLLEQIQLFAEKLSAEFKKHTKKSWQWFEDHLTYNNALLSESLLIAGTTLNNAEYTQTGLQSLDFLIRKTFSSNMYRPIGHSHWYRKDEKRSHYDQQPEEPASMILALAYAYKNTHNERYKNLAQKCYTWFLGNNTLNSSLYNTKTGGCYDGLQPGQVNLNQGAESLISYLLSTLTIKELP